MEFLKKEKIKENLIKYRSIVLLVGISLIMGILNDSFLTTSNFFTIFGQIAVNAVIAIGMTYVILTGGIDLSVGSILAFTGIIAAYLVTFDYPIIIVMLISISAGAFIGFINGVVITKGKVQPFIATLAMMTIIRGATLIISKGRPITTFGYKYSETFSNIGSKKILGLSISVYIAISILLIFYYILKYTSLGRYVFALGGNEEATKLSGVNVDKVKMKVYAISGALAGFGGIIATARLSSATPQAGSGYELEAIAAVVLGGTSLAGGKGSVIKTIIGALLLGVIDTSLNFLSSSISFLEVGPEYQQVIKGLVILFAVLIDRESN